MIFDGIEYYTRSEVAEKLGVTTESSAKTFHRLRDSHGMPFTQKLTSISRSISGADMQTSVDVYIKKEIDDWLAITKYKSRENRFKPKKKSVEQMLEEREIARLESEEY